MYWCALYSLHFYLVSNYELCAERFAALWIMNVLVCNFLLSFMIVVHHPLSWCGLSYFFYFSLKDLQSCRRAKRVVKIWILFSKKYFLFIQWLKLKQICTFKSPKRCAVAFQKDRLSGGLFVVRRGFEDAGENGTT